MSNCFVGDWWLYDLESAMESGIDEIELVGTARIEVTSDSIGAAQFDSTFQCYELRFTANGTISGHISGHTVTGEWTMEGEDYLLKTDQSEVRSRMTTHIVATSGSFSMSYEERVLHRFNPPLDSSAGFPITVGKSWSATSTRVTDTKTTADGEENEETNETVYTKDYYVLDAQRITVPAGTFETFLIGITEPEGSSTNEYYSADAGTSVKIESLNPTAGSSMTLELREYHYSGEGLPWLWIFGGVGAAAVVVIVAAYAVHTRKKPPSSPVPPTPGTEKQT